MDKQIAIDVKTNSLTDFIGNEIAARLVLASRFIGIPIVGHGRESTRSMYAQPGATGLQVTAREHWLAVADRAWSG